MRRWSLVFLASVSFAAVASAKPPALGDFGQLDQKDEWKVTTVEAQGSSYCAMTGTFDKDVYMAFARNPDGTGTIALDFPQKLFEAGQSYDVTLRTARDKIRKLSAKASGEKSVVVEPGNDKYFYEALEAGKDIEIALPKIGAAFAVHDFIQAYGDLGSCMTHLDVKKPAEEPVVMASNEVQQPVVLQPAAKEQPPVPESKPAGMMTAEKPDSKPAEPMGAAAPVAAVETAATSDEIAALQAERDQLRRDLEQALAFNTMTAPNPQDVKANEDKITELKARLEESERRKEILAEKADKISQERERLRRELEQKEADIAQKAEAERKLAELQKTLDKKQTAIEKLKAKLQQAKVEKAAAAQEPVAIVPETDEDVEAAATHNRAAAFLDRVMAYHRKGGAGNAAPVRERDEEPVFAKKEPAPAVVMKSKAAPLPAKAEEVKKAQIGGIPVTLETLLIQAGIQDAHFVSVDDAEPGETVRQWTAGNMTGLYEEVPSSGSGFNADVESYIDRYYRDCPGYLDVSTPVTKEFDAGIYATADMTCSMKGNEYATSLVFLEQGANFAALLHTAPLADADVLKPVGRGLAQALSISGGIVNSDPAEQQAFTAGQNQQLKLHIPDVSDDDEFKTVIIE